MDIKAPKGTRDILPSESAKWQYIEKKLYDICNNFGYSEIRIPVFEYTQLFNRGVGETTDIVNKEMYTFLDKGGRSITLRPEGTAGVVRSYIQNGMASYPQPVKLYYNITAYRYENVQKGRYREFHQFGVEAFGSFGPEIDVEIMSILNMFFHSLSLDNISLRINSIGCKECREKYDKILKDFLSTRVDNMCDNCKERYLVNPLRILDCKEHDCKKQIYDAPKIVDTLCNECKAHFNGVKRGLDNLGIKYKVDKNIVRGLDYYTRTVFEFISPNVGTQGTVCGGGRYDSLVEVVGGKSTPGIGFALGIERLLMEIESQEIEIPSSKRIELYIAAIGNPAIHYAQNLSYQLREKDIRVEMDLLGRSLKSQMKQANKLNAKLCIVIGDNEIESEKAVMKEMETGEEKEVSLGSVVDRMIRNVEELK